MFKFKPGFEITNGQKTYEVIEGGKAQSLGEDRAVYKVEDLLALEALGPWYCFVDNTNYYIPTQKERKIIDLIRDEDDVVKNYVRGVDIAKIMDYEIVNHDAIARACKPDSVSLDEDDFKFLVEYDENHASEAEDDRVSELRAMFRGR